MSTKYRNPASVAQERVLELSSQWKASYSSSSSNSNNNASYSASSSDESSSGKQQPGKGLLKETRSSNSNYAEEEDARLGDPEAEWKSGNANPDAVKNGGAKSGGKGSLNEDEKAKKTQPKGENAQKYAKEEDDSLKAEDTGAPSKEARKDK